jgi:hypothetical protein
MCSSDWQNAPTAVSWRKLESSCLLEVFCEHAGLPGYDDKRSAQKKVRRRHNRSDALNGTEWRALWKFDGLWNPEDKLSVVTSPAAIAAPCFSAGWGENPDCWLLQSFHCRFAQKAVIAPTQTLG